MKVGKSKVVLVIAVIAAAAVALLVRGKRA
jgi:hypothetical protein